MKLGVCVLLGLLSSFVVPDRVYAQGGHRVTLNPYIGVLMIDDGELQELDFDGEEIDVEIDPSILFGGRVGIQMNPSWTVEGALGYSPVSADVGGIGFIELDGDATLFYGALNYSFPSSGTGAFFLSGGAGGIRLSLDDVGDFEGSSSTDLLLNFGAGFTWDATEHLTIRGDVKDHLQFCQVPDDFDDFSICPEDDAILNNLEFSAGLVFALGGEM